MNHRFSIIKGAKRAFSLVEVLIVVFIMSVAFVSFYTVSTVGTKYIIESKNRLAATALTNEKMEIVRNMAYDDIGTDGGFVGGDIDPDENVTANGRQFNVKTYVSYVDDPRDGTEDNDENGVTNDYKIVKIVVLWTDSNGGTQEVSSVSQFAPSGLETETELPGAPWVINVSENTGGSLVGVLGSEVYIYNNDISPAINTSQNTNSDGNVLIVSAPGSNEGYHITVSHSGYETIETMDTTPTFLPVYPHASVALGFLNTNNFLQNRTSDLTIRTADYQDNPVGNINFTITGGKLVGYESGVSVFHMSSISSSEVYKQSSDSDATGTESGEKKYEDLSPGSYTVAMDPNEQNGFKFIDFDPSESPAVLNPGVDLVYRIKVAPSDREALLVSIRDDLGHPISGATAKLTDSVGTEIFSGKTSSARGIIFFPDGTDELAVGNYTLTIEAIGFGTDTEPVTIAAGGITEKNIVLMPGI